MHDPAYRMCGLPADRELAFEIAVEGNTIVEDTYYCLFKKGYIILHMG